jgi:hypothetical protein
MAQKSFRKKICLMIGVKLPKKVHSPSKGQNKMKFLKFINTLIHSTKLKKNIFKVYIFSDCLFKKLVG